jgi:hypothetical protein
VSPGANHARRSGSPDPGEVDYRLARATRLEAFRTGRASQLEVCDAQPELMRNAERASRRTRRQCPICDHRHLVEVTYVFGPRLPPSGRCITSPGELDTLAQKAGRHEAYIVEVCTACRWNHLVRSHPLRAEDSATGAPRPRRTRQSRGPTGS